MVDQGQHRSQKVANSRRSPAFQALKQPVSSDSQEAEFHVGLIFVLLEHLIREY